MNISSLQSLIEKIKVDRIAIESSTEIIDYNLMFNYTISLIQCYEKVGAKYSDEIYIETKKALKYYSNGFENGYYLFDLFNIEIIVGIIKNLSIDKQLVLMRILIRILNKNNYLDELDNVEKKFKYIQLQYFIKNLSVKNFLKLIHLVINYNHITSLFFLILFVLSFSVILMPSNDVKYNFIQYDVIRYSDFLYFDCILNTLIKLFSFSDSDFWNPINWKGVILILVFKLLFVIYITSFVLATLSKFLKK